MMKLIEFIFSNFWVFLGICILIALTGSIVKESIYMLLISIGIRRIERGIEKRNKKVDDV
ncbi:hypothetical protein EG832_02115 [bacterium]|nr:hypothetical protein [bacterium]